MKEAAAPEDAAAFLISSATLDLSSVIAWKAALESSDTTARSVGLKLLVSF